MSINPLVLSNSMLADVANAVTVEIQLVGQACGVNGVVLVPHTIHSQAASKVHVGLSGTTDGASAVLTAAKAATIVADPLNSALSASLTALKTGLVSHFAAANQEAVADGADIVSFAVGGLGMASISKAELEWVSIAAAGTNMVKKSVLLGPSLDLGDTVVLNGSNVLLKLDGSTAIDFDGDPLVTAKGVGFGVFKIRDTGTAGDQFEAGQPVVLRLTIKN